MLPPILLTRFGKRFGARLLNILASVLAGAYVFDIAKTSPAGVQFLDWGMTPHSASFWALLVVFVLREIYGLAVAESEEQAPKPASKADIQARAIEALLEPWFRFVQKDMENGKLRTLDDVMKIIWIDKRSGHDRGATASVRRCVRPCGRIMANPKLLQRIKPALHSPAHKNPPQ